MNNLQMIDVEKLNIDMSYQRGDISQARITKMSQNFDIKKFGLLTVSKRKNGTYWIVDGQRRFHAAKIIGIKSVPCHVVEVSSVKEEAEIFTGYDCRVSITPLSKFKALCVAQDVDAINLRDMMAKYGYRACKNDDICVACIAKVFAYFQKKSDIVERVFAFAKETNMKMTEYLFRGLFYIAERKNYLEDFDFIKKFSTKGHARINRECGMMGSSKKYDRGLAITILDFVSSGKGSKKKWEIE